MEVEVGTAVVGLALFLARELQHHPRPQAAIKGSALAIVDSRKDAKCTEIQIWKSRTLKLSSSSGSDSGSIIAFFRVSPPKRGSWHLLLFRLFGGSALAVGAVAPQKQRLAKRARDKNRQLMI